MRRLFLHTALAAALCLSASGAAACDISIGDTGFNIGMATNKATETWTRSYAVSAGGTFEVENTNGLVEVLQGTGPKVEVSAGKIAKASSDEAAKDLLTKIEIVETVKPESVRLETKTPKVVRVRRRRSEVHDQGACRARASTRGRPTADIKLDGHLPTTSRRRPPTAA